MFRLRAALVALAVMLMLTLAGCGAGSRPDVVKRWLTRHTAVTHPCRTTDYAMHCALRKQPKPRVSVLPGATRAYGFGVDFAWGGPSAAALSAAGKSFAASYFSPDFSKNWTAGLVDAYHAAKIATVGVFESLANRTAQGCAAGTADAIQARVQAAAVGNTTRPIYAGVDFDTSLDPSVIRPYFVCWSQTLGLARSGAYGGLATIRYLFDAGLIRYGWQTYAWSGGQWDPRAQLRQFQNDVFIAGVDTDLDVAVAPDFGQWPYAAPNPPPPRLICFGVHAKLKNATCRRVRARVARADRAYAASLLAQEWRGCSTLQQRIGWFSGRLRAHPRVKTIRRRRALAVSRREYHRRACALFVQRIAYFNRLHAQLVKQYS